ncbi:flagellar biosynthesis protein FlhA [Spirochaetia bacterium]|nr:flagellar biosynthesis protein FlhA [Spirochaetia bacterium]
MADIALGPQVARSPLGDTKDLVIAAAVVAVVMMLVIPMPTVILDALMALNLVMGLLILLIVLYTRKATDFSIFPTVILITTVFGLALNVSSTRLILTKGMDFEGRMIRSFSTFVVGSGGTEGLVVGLIIFIVIIAVQMAVITKGSTRIAEVAARFTLDKMPAKQMAVESEFNQGAITEAEMKRRKEEIDQESSFYGAMDGASKFIAGNVKVGIFITVVNIVAGFIVGVAIHGEPVAAAFSTYVALTIGDGLLSQMPALLISTATGMIVTRSVSNGTFAEDVTNEFTQQPRIFWIGAVVLMIFALIPGFPWYVLVPLALLLGFAAYRLGIMQRQKAAAGSEASTEADEKQKSEQSGEMAPIAPLDPLSLELGYALVPLVDKDKGAELLERVQHLRRESALDLGLVIPKIRIVDNMALDPAEYCIKIKGVEVGRGRIRMGYYLCINPSGIRDELPGERTVDPTFGLPAVWVSEEHRDEAERAGYTVVDPPSIIATHLTEIIKSHAGEILGRQDTAAILETLKKDYSAVVDDVQKNLTLVDIQKVLQGLLREQVSIRNIVTILETISDYASVSKVSHFLVEKARQALGRQICLQYTDDERKLHILTLEQSLEEKIVSCAVDTANGRVAAPPPDLNSAFLKAVNNAAMIARESGAPPVIVCSEQARALVKQLTEREIPELAVLSIPEIVQDVDVVQIGEIKV